MDTIADGRRNASLYFHKVAKEYPDIEKELEELAALFGETAKISCDMADMLGGCSRGEEQMMALSKRETRERIVGVIEKAKDYDTKALKVLEKLYDRLG